MQRRIWPGVGIAYLCLLGYVGRKIFGGGVRTTNRAAGAATPAPILTPVDDDHDPGSDFANYACGSGYPLGRLQRAIGGRPRRFRPAAW